MNKADSLASATNYGTFSELVGLGYAVTSSPEVKDQGKSSASSLLSALSSHRNGSVAKGCKQHKLSNSLQVSSFSQNTHGNHPPF